MIVGTDLKRIERITGRLTTGRVALGGLLSGVWLGLFVGLVLSLFADGGSSFLATILATMLFGALFGVIWALVGYAAHPRPARLLVGDRGGRDEVRGAGRAQVRRPGPRAARRPAGRSARPVRPDGHRAGLVRPGGRPTFGSCPPTTTSRRASPSSSSPTRSAPSPAEVERAIQSVLPALLGGLQANAADPGGAASLADALGHHDNGLARRHRRPQPGRPRGGRHDHPARLRRPDRPGDQPARRCRRRLGTRVEAARAPRADRAVLPGQADGPGRLGVRRRGARRHPGPGPGRGGLRFRVTAAGSAVSTTCSAGCSAAAPRPELSASRRTASPARCRPCDGRPGRPRSRARPRGRR